MANLIITIISIALVAVAALMGAYYGGIAFSSGSYKAKAAAYYEQGKQISAAIQLWQANNGQDFIKTGLAGNYNSNNSTTSASAPTPIANLLVPTYLGNMPKPDPTDIGTISGSVTGQWALAGSDDFRNLQASQATYGWYLFLYASSPPNKSFIEICKEVAKLGRGPNAVPYLYTTGWTKIFEPGMNADIDCAWSPVSPALANIDLCLNRVGSPTDNGCQVRIVHKAY